MGMTNAAGINFYTCIEQENTYRVSPQSATSTENYCTYEHLSLSNDLIGPRLLIKVCSVAVRDGVRGDLVPVGVEVLHLGVVGPLVGHVESGL